MRAPVRLGVTELAPLLSAPSGTSATITIGTTVITAEVVEPLPREIGLRLRYEFDGETFDVLLIVVERRSPVATRRFWACPICTRACRDVYRKSGSGTLACRVCLDLAYESQRHQPRSARARRALDRIAQCEARLLRGRLRPAGRARIARRLATARDRLDRLRAEAVRVATRRLG